MSEEEPEEKRRVLVVANVTATAAALSEVIQRLAADTPSHFTFLVPAYTVTSNRSGTWEENEVWHEAEARMKRAVEVIGQLGLEVDGRVGDADPVSAVRDLLMTERYDLVVVSTLPEQRSRWLVANLPDRIARTTGLPVLHVVAHEASEPVPT